MSTYLRASASFLTVAGPRWALLGSANLCWPLLAFAGLCWPLLAFAGICWALLGYEGSTHTSQAIAF